MMRAIRKLLVLFLIAVGSYHVLEEMSQWSNKTNEHLFRSLHKKEHKLESKVLSQNDSLFQWIGRAVDTLEEVYGEADHKHLSAYGYTWWVYTDQTDQYIQFGIEDEKVVTVYTAGHSKEAEPVHIGDTYAEVNEQLSFGDAVTYDNFTFRLNQQEERTRPLAKLSNNVFIQCYFDTFTNQLAAMRIATGDVLLKHSAYEIAYRGTLPESITLNKDEWSEVEKGMEEQLYALTNMVRKRYGKESLEWAADVSEVAFLHSQDMKENDYFSHYDLNGNGLKERLLEKNIYYAEASENIAAQYPDAPSA